MTTPSFQSFLTETQNADLRNPAFWTANSRIVQVEEPERSQFISELKDYFLERQEAAPVGSQNTVLDLFRFLDVPEYGELIESERQRLLELRRPLSVLEASWAIQLLGKRISLTDDKSDIDLALDLAKTALEASDYDEFSWSPLLKLLDALVRILSHGSRKHFHKTVAVALNAKSHKGLVLSARQRMFLSLGVSESRSSQLNESLTDLSQELLAQAESEARPDP